MSESLQRIDALFQLVRGVSRLDTRRWLLTEIYAELNAARAQLGPMDVQRVLADG